MSLHCSRLSSGSGIIIGHFEDNTFEMFQQEPNFPLPLPTAQRSDQITGEDNSGGEASISIPALAQVPHLRIIKLLTHYLSTLNNLSQMIIVIPLKDNDDDTFRSIRWF